MIIVIRRKPLIGLIFLVMIISVSLLLWEHFKFSEPPFVIIGDNKVLSKLHINVYMDRDEGPNSWNTIFLNGKPYQTNIQNVDRFIVYVNYDNKLFIDYSYDNIAKMVNDSSIAPNTLLFCEINSNIFLSDSLKRCKDVEDGKPGLRKLLPLEDIINRDVSEAKNNQNIKDKSGEESFIFDLRKSFFEITNHQS